MNRFLFSFFGTLLAAFLLAGTAPAIAGSMKTAAAVPDADKSRTDLAVLVLPVTLDLEMVDGMSYPKAKVMRTGDLAVQVLPGEREIALRYSQLFEIDADSHEIVKSKIIVLKFVAQPGKTYHVQHDVFRSVDAAHDGVRNFAVRVLDDTGANQVMTAGQIQKNWRGEETTTSRPDLVARDAAGTPLEASPAASAGSMLDALKAVWRSAGEADRAAFLDWVKSSP